MEYNSNIERQKYASASKEEKARHNGVDTRRWGNDCPRIAVPDGWEDHQYTQQLIRKYLDNSFATYDFKRRRLVLWLTEDEKEALRNLLDNGCWVVRKRVFINQTALGLCLEVRVRKPDEDWDDDDKGLFTDYNGGIWRVNSSIFSEVEILKREEVSVKTKVLDMKDSYLRCNSLDITVEPVTICGKTVSKFTMPRKQAEERGIKVGLAVEVSAGQMIEAVAGDTTVYIKRVAEQANVLVEYSANMCTSDRVAKVFGKEPSDELSSILSDFQHEWDEVEVDEDGATPEQDAELDTVLDKYQRLINAL